jgi:hypothetical protein
LNGMAWGHEQSGAKAAFRRGVQEQTGFHGQSAKAGARGHP